MNNRFKIILGLAIFLGTIGLSIWQWSVLQSHNIQINSLKSEAANLRVISEGLAENYQDLYDNVSESRQKDNQNIGLAFPTEENITDLNRLFDEFSVKNNFQSNPFFISSVSYQNIKMEDGADYRVVPISMSISTSRKNLDKFLEFVESSGSLQNGVRLMSVESMSFQYPGEFGGIYDVKLEISAYFSREI